MTITPAIVHALAEELATDYVELLALDPRSTPNRVAVAKRQILDLDDLQRDLHTWTPEDLEQCWHVLSVCRDGLAQYMCESGIHRPN